MDLTLLTETIIKSVVKDEEVVEVVKTLEEDNFIQIDVKVSTTDMGRVIGKDGRIINAIRTLIQEASSLKDNKYVKIEVEKK